MSIANTLFFTQDGDIFSKTFGTDTITAITYDPNKCIIFIGTSGGKISLINQRNKHVIRSFLCKQPISKLLVCENYIYVGSDPGKLYIYDITEDKLVSTLEHHSDRITDIVLIKEENLIITSSYDNSIVFYNFLDNSETLRLERDFPVEVLSYNHYLKVLFFAENCSVFSCSIFDKQPFANSYITHQKKITSLDATIDNILISSCLDGNLKINDIDSRNTIFSLNLNEPIRHLRCFYSDKLPKLLIFTNRKLICLRKLLEKKSRNSSSPSCYDHLKNLDIQKALDKIETLPSITMFRYHLRQILDFLVCDPCLIGNVSMQEWTHFFTRHVHKSETFVEIYSLFNLVTSFYLQSPYAISVEAFEKLSHKIDFMSKVFFDLLSIS